MADRQQLALDLRLQCLGGQHPDDFLISDANREAVRWLDGWRQWPAPALILYGPAGCGKSHLVGWFCERTDGLSLPVDALVDVDHHGLAACGRVCVVEDADRPRSEATEQPLLHLYNAVAAAGGRLLLTARVPPRAWSIRLPDLRSRLQAAPTAAILAPDEALLGAIVRKLFEDRQLIVDDDVVNYLLPRIERSFAALSQIVDRLDHAALKAQRRLTVPFVRAALTEDKSLDRT